MPASRTAPLSILVTWSPRRRSLTRRFGVLTVDPPSITLRDRDGTVLAEGPGTTFVVEKIAKTMIGITGPDNVTRYIVGPHSQLARQASARRIIETYQAVVVPPPHPLLSEKSYRSIISSGSPYGSGTRALTQHLLWQPLLLQLLWQCHATPRAGSA